MSGDDSSNADPTGANSTGADPTGDDSTGADSTDYDSTGADHTGADPTGACMHCLKIITSSKKIAHIYLQDHPLIASLLPALW